jgi:hypothetical protein
MNWDLVSFSHFSGVATQHRLAERRVNWIFFFRIQFPHKSCTSNC